MEGGLAGSYLGEIEMTLEPGEDVRVTIQDRYGRPVRHAQVRLEVGEPDTFHTGASVHLLLGSFPYDYESGLFQGYEQIATADSQGRMVFPCVPVGIREVRWVAEGCLNIGNLEFAADATEIRIVADLGDSVAGRVLDSQGLPLAGVKVRLEQPVNPPDSHEEVCILGFSHGPTHWTESGIFTTDASGRFEVYGLERGNWFFFHLYFGGVDFQTPWRQDNGFAHDFVLPPFHRVSGRVVRPRIPSNRISEKAQKEWSDTWDHNWIHLQRPDSYPEESPIESPSHSIELQPDGSFFCIVPSGPLILEVDAGPIQMEMEIDVQADIDLGEITLVAPPLCIVVGVVPANPDLEEHMLSLFCLERFGLPDPFRMQYQGEESDFLYKEAGSLFRLEELAPGRYCLLVEAVDPDGQAYAAYLPPFEVRGPDTRIQLPPLQPAAELELTLSGFGPWCEQKTETTLRLIPFSSSQADQTLAWSPQWQHNLNLNLLSREQRHEFAQHSQLTLDFYDFPPGTYQLHFHTYRNHQPVHHVSPLIQIQAGQLATHTWRLPPP